MYYFVMEFVFVILCNCRKEMDIQVTYSEGELKKTSVRINKKVVNVYKYIPPCNEGDTIKSKNYEYNVGRDDHETRLNKYKAHEQLARSMARLALEIGKADAVKQFIRSMDVEVNDTDDEESDDEESQEPAHKKRMTELQEAIRKL